MAQTCANCFDTILSDKHKQECCTVPMCSQKTYKYKDESTFKPMMTFGLNGCYAFFIINKELETITLGHFPPIMKNAVISTLKDYMNDDRCIIYLKVPGVYEKDEATGKWTTDTSFKMFEFLDSGSCEVIKEMYSCYSVCSSFCSFDNINYNYMSSIYIDYDMIDGTLDYTDNYGKWINISC